MTIKRVELVLYRKAQLAYPLIRANGNNKVANSRSTKTQRHDFSLFTYTDTANVLKKHSNASLNTLV